MSAVIGDNATKVADPSPSNILIPGLIGGKVRVMVETYTCASLGSGSTIKIGKALPAGAIIVGAQLAAAALGSGVTISLGDSASAARYIAALTCTSAQNSAALVTGAMGYVIGTNTGDTQILVTTGGATGTGKITVLVFYVVE